MITMTPPIIVQQVICQFFNQWYAGLRPKIVLKTKDSGAIVISSIIVLNQRHRRKSGHASRQRRKAARAGKKVDSNSTQTDDLLDDTDETPALQPLHSYDSDKCPVDTAVQAACTTVDAACEAMPLPPPKPKPILSTVKNASISVLPRTIYHPAIHNVARTMFSKHPSELVKEEIVKPNSYCTWNGECGEPVETNVVHLPSTMRDCLHCGHPT